MTLGRQLEARENASAFIMLCSPSCKRNLDDDALADRMRVSSSHVQFAARERARVALHCFSQERASLRLCVVPDAALYSGRLAYALLARVEEARREVCALCAHMVCALYPALGGTTALVVLLRCGTYGRDTAAWRALFVRMLAVDAGAHVVYFAETLDIDTPLGVTAHTLLAQMRSQAASVDAWVADEQRALKVQ